MAQPTFLTSGDSPKRRDTLWFRWVRILSRYQNQPGASPANNPSRLDTIRQLKYKVLKAVRNSAGIVGASLVLSAGVDDESIDWTWNQSDPTSWVIEQSIDPDTGFFQVATAGPSERTWENPTFFKFYRVVVVGGEFDGMISNVISIPS